MNKIVHAKIMEKFRALPSRKEKVEFLYAIQEQARLKYNTVGDSFRNGVISENQWNLFKKQWKESSLVLNEKLSQMRDAYFLEDMKFTKPTSREDSANIEIIDKKKEELKKGIAYKEDINTIWQQ